MEEYYKPTEQDIFDEVKRLSIEIWQSYENGTDYAQSKIDRIKDIENVSDNTCYMVAMFDRQNQTKLFMMASPKTQEWLLRLLKEGDI